MTEVVPMNDTFAWPIRKFNPGMFQSDDEVVRQFVVRQRELDLVLEIIRSNIDSPSCQHVLIVAPRGRGKTMLLARVCAELRTNNALSERLFPVRFMEESQEIVTLADFWLEALFHLAHANATGNPKLSQELLATHADLTARWRDTNIEGYARAAVLAAADRLGQKLVLMVENLQTLCSDVDKDFGWKLRQTLQSEPHIMLLATATSRFKGLDDATQPFFELFRIVDLEPLDTVACRQLWNMVSSDAQTSREIKPLQILTGGSPRLIIIVATFARHRSLRRLLEDLVTLVDDHTEYFRSHLEGLAKIERRVYLAVIDLWQPSSVHEIAARARIDIRTVSALIARLVNRGAVLVEGTGRKRRYSAAERLYSIYYKLRRERDEAELVRNLIQFMTVFYHSDELAEMTGTWRMEAAQSTAIREGLERGLAASDTLDLQMEVAKALLNKGITHGQRDESEAEMAALTIWSRVLEVATPRRFRSGLQRRCSSRALRTASAANPRRRWPSEDLVSRYGGSDNAEIQDLVATALFNKGSRTASAASPKRNLPPTKIWSRVLEVATPLRFRCGLPRPCSTRALRTASAANPRRSWPPTTIWSRVLEAATPLRFRCGLPRCCSTRVSRTASATNPRRRWPPATIWSRVMATAAPLRFRCGLLRRYSTRASRTASAASPRRRWPLTKIWSRVMATATPRRFRCRLPWRCSTRAPRTISATSPRRRWPPAKI